MKTGTGPWERQRQTDHYHTRAVMEVCLGNRELTGGVPASSVGGGGRRKGNAGVVGL